MGLSGRRSSCWWVSCAADGGVCRSRESPRWGCSWLSDEMQNARTGYACMHVCTLYIDIRGVMQVSGRLRGLAGADRRGACLETQIDASECSRDTGCNIGENSHPRVDGRLPGGAGDGIDRRHPWMLRPTSDTLHARAAVSA